MPRAFIGTWISDGDLTLRSVRESQAVSEKDLAIFEDDFFGHRVMVFGDTESGAYFADTESGPTMYPNRIVDSGENFVVFLIPATEYSPEHEQAWYAEGDIIYAYVEKWQFKEYFRRADGK